MAERVTRVICAADPRGSAELIERLLQASAEHRAQVAAVVGDLSDGHGGSAGYRAVFRALGAGGLPAYWVPGPADAPVVDYLREAANVEVVFPFLHGVHGTAAFAPDGHFVFAGLGGEVSDDPDEPRDELERLRYPRWEVEYRLKLLRELGEHQLVLTFWTPPAHKGLGEPGAEVLAELVATYRPRLVVCDGERGTRTIGRSMVVSPGSLGDGHYAVVDLHAREASLEMLEAART
jgi:Icc-related predicted phosphoesterase